jgi:hypothetical protein
MNKRFKELAKQAGLQQTKWADADTEDERVRIWQESLNNPGSLEKFAELIVKECSDFLKDTLDDYFAAEQLEEHFGVEE